MTTQPRIKTTVVGSYPFPDWLGALPSEQAVIDATRVVIHTQEQAGIDLVCDGELYRFDVNHPETNGMIEYFVKPMAGIRTGSHVRRTGRLPGAARHEIPHASAGRRRGAGRRRHARPSAGLRTREAAHRPAVQVHADRAAHARQDALRRSLQELAELTMAIADALAAQVRYCDAEVIQVDEANLPGSPEEWEWAAEAMNRVLDAVKTTPAVHLCFGNYGGQSIQKGTWAQLMEYLNALHVDHIVMETAHRPADELAVFRDLRPQIGFGLGVVDIKSTEIETADDDRARDRARRKSGRRRAGSNTFIRTAASGCSSAVSPTARFRPWSRDAISIRAMRPEGAHHGRPRVCTRCRTDRSALPRDGVEKRARHGSAPATHVLHGPPLRIGDIEERFVVRAARNRGRVMEFMAAEIRRPRRADVSASSRASR